MAVKIVQAPTKLYKASVQDDIPVTACHFFVVEGYIYSLLWPGM
jgi:hypothetical protein